jgi:hypothetical protein
MVSAVVGLAIPTTSVHAHPTDLELRQAFEELALCESDSAPADRVDAARLGMTESELRQAVDGLRRDPPASEADSDSERGPVRWLRDAQGELQGVEYESWQDRVYRIRWQLSPSFERPVFGEFLRRAEICFGTPEYDQTFEAEPGSPKATLRRVAWIHGDRRIELRQLHPLRGDRVYLTITTSETLREIAAAGFRVFPEPDRSEPWWRRPTQAPRPATADERDALGRRFAALLSQLDH